MSERVVELNRTPNQEPPQFERTPPQDLAAEQSVLGGMLLNKDAIGDVIEVLHTGDFYRPAHQLIFDVIVELYGKGEPADAITVGAELTKDGDIGRVGGLPYLHTLVSMVPTAANAGYYAKIVGELAILRRLVEAGTKIVQLGYASEGNEVDDVVDRAQQVIYDVTERRTTEDYMLLEQLMQPTMDELEAIGGRNGMMSGVPTGFVDLDALTNGLHPGQLIVIAGRPGLGKALALDTPLPTPTGWTTMGEVRTGDELLGADGRPTRVVAATDVMVGRPCYEVEFSDGTRIVADAEHQWLTSTRADRRAGSTPSIRTTEQLASSLRLKAKDARHNHAVATTAPLELPEASLPFSPYGLGVLLGSGHSNGTRLNCAEPEIVMHLEADGLEVKATSAPGVCAVDETEVLTRLGVLGPLGDRHIPIAYLRASVEQREALLAGLMDAVGTVTPTGALHFASVNRQLAFDVQELVLSLGHRATMTARRVEGKTEDTRTSYTLDWCTDRRVFRLEAKHLQHKDLLGADARIGQRWITSVVPVESVPVRCVEVDNSEHLYLASRSMIPTHNSTLGLDIARSAAIKNGQAAVIFSLEMSKTEITMRLLSAEARVPLHHMRAGSMTDDDWARLARRMGEVAEAPLYIDDSPNLTMMEIRSKARRLKQRNELRLIVIDYLQLMSGNKKAESRQQEVSELSRALKLLAKELEVPVIAMSQLNRGAEQRTDKKPLLADLRESGCLPASTRVLRADTGAEATLGELFASGAREVPVWSLDPSLRYVRRHLTHVFSTGVREVFKLTLASGKTVRATANHPFLTYDGWQPLGELAVGSRVAVPRHVPAPSLETVRSEAELVALARAVAAGASAEASGLVKRDVRRLLREVFALVGAVPAELQTCVLPTRAGADLVSRLLLRFGISCNVEATRQGSWLLSVRRGDDAARFAGQVLSGLDGDAARELTLDLLAKQRNSAAPVLQGLEATAGLASMVAVLDRQDLELEATNDIFWDAVVAIESDGVEEVFDATVVGNHNFVADGIVVHNSIEQDADMVVLLHREDAYEKESPRAGEADFIVAKHRNGPTATITVAFQGHYSRFVDMSPS